MAWSLIGGGFPLGLGREFNPPAVPPPVYDRGYAFHGYTQTIFLSEGATLRLPDLWSRAVDWWLDPNESNSTWPFPFLQVGGNAIDEGAGTSIPLYFFLREGWRIQPHESDHTLAVVDGVLVRLGGGDPFLGTDGDFVVRINYQQPVQAIGVDGALATVLADLAEIKLLIDDVPWLS